MWTLLALAPVAGIAQNEVLSRKALIVMTFINGPAYFQESARLSDREKIECYKREVDDMVKLHASACALDTFNTPSNRAHVKLFARAVQEYNDAHPGTNFGYFLLLDLPRSHQSSWANLEAVHQCFREIKNPYYATVDGEYVIATWHGEQFEATWWKRLGDLFAEREGKRVFIYNNFYDYNGKTVVDYTRQLTEQGIKTAYYDFITANDGKLDENIALAAKLRPLDVKVACGINSSFWAICSTKNNSGRYIDFDGYGWLMRYFERMLTEEPLTRFSHTWLTIWSDFGEDNYFVPAENPPPFPRNPVIPPWTHRGFYKLLQYYTQWWSEGRPPALKNEAMYWCYRQHPKGLPSAPGDQCAESRYPRTKQFLPTWDEARDAIYVVTRLNRPAILTVTLGQAVYRVECAPGLRQHRFDWAGNLGRPHFELKRNDAAVLTVDGKLEITDAPRGLDGSFTRNMHQYADYAETAE